MPDWLLIVIMFAVEFGLIFAVTYTIFNYPRNDAPGAIIPEGWKIKRRGFLGLRGFDARTPEGKWLTWGHHKKKSWAVEHAWTCARFEAEIKAMDTRWHERWSRLRTSTPPPDDSE